MSWAQMVPWGQAGAGVSAKAINLYLADKQQDFQRNMANTAHQREVNDLRKAGLNPILSARHGGAAVPPGARADIATPEVTSARQGMSQMAMNKAQIEDITSAAKLKDAQTADLNLTQVDRLELMRAQKEQALAQARKTGGIDTAKVAEEIRQISAQIDNLRVLTQSSALDQQKKRAVGQMWEIPADAISKGKEGWRSWWEKIKRKLRSTGATGKW